MDAAVVESGRRKFLDHDLHRGYSCLGHSRTCTFSVARLESVRYRPCGRGLRWLWNDDRFSSWPRASRGQTQSCRGTNFDFFCRLQRLGISEHVDREPSESPCEFRHDGRRLQSATRRVLVGASAMALPVATIEHEKVVPGYYAASIHFLEEGASSSCRHFTGFWLLPFRLVRFLLDRRHSIVVLPAHAVCR